jgi:glutathione S-transferase
MQLYTGRFGPNPKRVRICAHELGVELDLVELDFQQGQQRAPSYLALNPMGKVPTLSAGSFVLWESSAILCHLAEQSGGVLWPRESRALADTLRWLFFCACHLDPYFTTLVVERFVKARTGAAENLALTADAENWLARFVPVVEQQLAEHAFMTGEFGLADIALGCTLELSELLRFDLVPYPRVRAWLERLQSRDSWRSATVQIPPPPSAAS